MEWDLIWLVLPFVGVWVAPRTWVAGELVTAAQMNQHVRDNMSILITPMTTVGALFTTDDVTMTGTKKLYLSTGLLTFLFEPSSGIIDAYIDSIIRWRMTSDNCQVGGSDNSTGIGPYLQVGRNTNASTPAPGAIRLFDKAAVGHYLWMTTEGILQTGTTQPDFDGDTGGVNIGSQ